MSVALLTPDLRKILDGLTRRIGVLERRIQPTGSTTASTNDDVVFSYAGTLTSSTESPPVALRRSAVLSVLAVAFATAGSTSTSIDVKRNGSVIATVTVPSSTTAYNASVGVNFVAEDHLSVEVTTAGTGAADMTAAARFT